MKDDACRNILITGGAGYVGSVLTSTLITMGHRVTVLDNMASWERKIQSFTSGQLTLLCGDVRDEEVVVPAMKDCDVVVHLASIVGYPACEQQPELAQSVNVGGTQTVFDAARGRPVISMSSLSCLGRVSGELCDESTPPNPVSIYGSTKLQGEFIARDYGEAVVLRPATAFGASPRFRSDLLVHTFVKLALDRAEISVYEPNAWRCFVHVRDLALAAAHFIAHFSQYRGQTFNIGSNSLNIQKLTLARDIVSLFGGAAAVGSGSDLDQRDYKVCFDKLAGTGFRTSQKLSTSLLEVAAEF